MPLVTLPNGNGYRAENIQSVESRDGPAVVVTMIDGQFVTLRCDTQEDADEFCRSIILSVNKVELEPESLLTE